MSELFTGANREINPEEDFRKIIGEISRNLSGHLEVFRDFCRLYACELSLQTREEEYLEVAKRYDRETLFRFRDAMHSVLAEMEKKPFEDVLGVYYTEINSSATAKSRGEYYTPPGLSRIMAHMLFSPGADIDLDQRIEEGKPITVQEPSCGSGGMVLAMAEIFAPKKAVDLLRVTMIDISPLACDMAYINTTLWGIPAQILQGNSLAWKFENCWKNFNWARVGEDSRQAALRMIDLTKELFSPQGKHTEPPEAKPNITFPSEDNRIDDQGQFELDLNF